MRLDRLAIAYLRYAFDCRKSIPAEPFCAMRCDDLAADPRAAVEQVHAWLGMPT